MASNTNNNDKDGEFVLDESVGKLNPLYPSKKANPKTMMGVNTPFANNSNNTIADGMDIRGIKIQVLQGISKRLNIFNNAERVFYKGNI